PADVPSGAEQSPNSWTWKPCLPGLRPVILPETFTPPSAFVNVTDPATLLPDAEERLATAFVAGAARTTAAGRARTRTPRLSFITRSPFLEVDQTLRPYYLFARDDHRAMTARATAA